MRIRKSPTNYSQNHCANKNPPTTIRKGRYSQRRAREVNILHEHRKFFSCDAADLGVQTGTAMLEFVKTFDLLGSITQFLQERRQSRGISGNAIGYSWRYAQC